MSDAAAWYDQVSIPALLRHARTTYGQAMRRGLAEAGYDDIPGNGLYVIGAIARPGHSLGRIIAELGISKQAAGQLVDTLVLRGYLERTVDPSDRRRLNLSLTDRGQAAAAAQNAAREQVDAELLARVGAVHLAHTRATLAALIGIGRRTAASEAAATEED